jgi:hypothetical protein
MDAILTTSGSQTQLYKELRNKGKTAWEAINFMAEHYPYGDGLARDKSDMEAEKLMEKEVVKGESNE